MVDVVDGVFVLVLNAFVNFAVVVVVFVVVVIVVAVAVFVRAKKNVKEKNII